VQSGQLEEEKKTWAAKRLALQKIPQTKGKQQGVVSDAEKTKVTGQP
jgi:hypothetical protein